MNRSASGKSLPRRDIAHMPDTPIGAAVRKAVGQQLPSGLGTNSPSATVASPLNVFGSSSTRGVRIECLGHVQHALILQAIVAQEEVSPAALYRHIVAFVVPQLRQSLLDALARRNRLQDRLRQFVLRLYPARDLGSADAFEPVVRIGDSHAVVGIDMIGSPGGRIGQGVSEPERSVRQRRGVSQQLATEHRRSTRPDSSIVSRKIPQWSRGRSHSARLLVYASTDSRT